MQIINKKQLSEIQQEGEEKQLKTLADLYEGMADMNETINKLVDKVTTLENKIKVLGGGK